MMVNVLAVLYADQTTVGVFFIHRQTVVFIQQVSNLWIDLCVTTTVFMIIRYVTSLVQFFSDFFYQHSLVSALNIIGIFIFRRVPIWECYYRSRNGVLCMRWTIAKWSWSGIWWSIESTRVQQSNLSGMILMIFFYFSKSGFVLTKFTKLWNIS